MIFIHKHGTYIVFKNSTYIYAIKSCISLDITFPYLILSSNEPVQNYINFHECFKRIYLTNKIIFLVVIGDLK